jgi:hypothetical protein
LGSTNGSVKGNEMKKVMVVPLLIMATLMAACNTNWIQTAQQYIAILTPAIEDVIGILQIAGVRGVSQTDLNLVAKYAAEATSDLNEINSLVTQYNSANAATTAQKIQEAADDAKANLNSVLPALHITDPKTVEKVTAAVDLAVNTITQLEALVPQATPFKPTVRSTAVKPLRPSQLQKQFNQIFAQ